MVGRWGMSEEIGPITVLPSDSRGPFLPGADAPSQQTQELVDREVRRLVDDAYDEVVALLRDNRDKLDGLASALVENETLEEDEAYRIAGVARPPREEPRPAPLPA